jgi:hypothetical protein
VLLFSHVITLFLFPQLFFRSALTPFFVVVQRLNRLLGSLIMLSFSDYIAFFLENLSIVWLEEEEEREGKNFVYCVRFSPSLARRPTPLRLLGKKTLFFCLKTFVGGRSPSEAASR